MAFQSGAAVAQLSLRHIQVLVVMTIVWGMNWPVMKYAVNQYPPLAFRTLCMILGVVCLWGIARLLNVSLRVPKALIGKVMLLAIPNMIGWHLLCILGVSQLSSGRAAILGYTMPVWAVLAGVAWGQGVSGRGWVALSLSMVAMMLLLASELNALTGNPLGVITMACAAASWGLGTAMVRQFTTGLHPLAFTHAMLLPTIVAMGVASLVFEGTAHGLPQDWSIWWPVLYNAVGVFAFCQVGWFFLASTLPPIASSLSVMFIPIVGVASGVVALREPVLWTDLTALGLILASMSLVLLAKKK
ncbi:MAG: DMT family transporter [Limnobacter sp.]|nr:DMT family transporter [Limnobacter sp.]